MFRFSQHFTDSVKGHFGKEMSPRIAEAMEDGDYQLVRTHLHGSREAITIQMVSFLPDKDLKARAKREISLEALIVRCDEEIRQRRPHLRSVG